VNTDRRLDLVSTLAGSLLEGFFPRGWDLARMEEIASRPPEDFDRPEPYWSASFRPVACEDVHELEVRMGLEIASEIIEARREGREIALILPVGPMGMYRWTVAVLERQGVRCDHVWGFNMDEWSDSEGRVLPPDRPGSFQNAMESVFYGPLGVLSVPRAQRFFATPLSLPKYAENIDRLRSSGAKVVLVYGIGRMLHIAFWEPHFAADYANIDSWRAATHRLGAKLHPLTIEQNAITSFKSRTTLVPAFANTIGPGIFLGVDIAIGGADGVLGRGMQWQGFGIWSMLHYGPDPWLPATFVPGMPGRLFYAKELAGPLDPECN
jgi:glucosamine-6-phosphate deaminase